MVARHQMAEFNRRILKIKNGENDMKARIKSTGEVVEVYNYSKHNHEIEYCPCRNCGEYQSINIDDVDILIDPIESPVGDALSDGVDIAPVKVIDWEQRRFELVKSIMANSLESIYRTSDNEEKIVSKAICLADELVRQLKEMEETK